MDIEKFAELFLTSPLMPGTPEYNAVTKWVSREVMISNAEWEVVGKWLPPLTYAFTPEMGEISGFGGAYERRCQ